MSVVGDAAVRSRGVGVNDAAASAREVDEHNRISTWQRSHKSEARCVFTALMFLTRVPCPSCIDHHPGFLMLSMAWFPCVGACIGWIAGCVFDAVRILLPESAVLCSAASVVATMTLTMCFHEDGLADTFDAVGGAWGGVDEILKILKDSRLGTFGSAALTLYLIGKTLLVGELGRSPSEWILFGSTGAAPVLVVVHAMARATAAPLLYVCPYVVDDEDSKGEFYAWFGRSRDLLSWQRVLFSFVTAGALAWLVLGLEAAAIGLLVTVLVCHVGKRYGRLVLGGVQGDFLGATICLCETLLYTVFAACSAALPPGETKLRFVFPKALAEAHSLPALAGVLSPLLNLIFSLLFLFKVASRLQ